ncbi:hypothetical protein BDR26DRAFT_867659 [Obelidium mucronatum]|nr:hypothetical protein BDR26DRAFT_867659 [Obelidium mucronatum]
MLIQLSLLAVRYWKAVFRAAVNTSKRAQAVLFALTLLTILWFSMEPTSLTPYGFLFRKSPGWKKHLPSEFLFIPPPTTRPLKKNAIMTLLASSPSALNPETRELDWYSFGATLQTYLYNHHHKLPDDTEYVVMITPLIPHHIRQTLLSLGARLLVVPPLQIKGVSPTQKGHQYEFVHTKLQMWRLENVYSSILSIDADLFHIRTNPIPTLFQTLKDSKKPANTVVFFGGCKDCCNNELNVGLFLFEPRVRDFNAMVDLASTEPYNKHMEQSLITTYFNETTNITWFDYQQNNMVTVSKSTNLTQGFHYKFWHEKYGNAGEEVYKLFQERLVELRGLQVRLMREAASSSGDAGIVLVPVFPDSWERWGDIRNANAMYQRVAILSMSHAAVKVGDVEERTRVDYANTFHQADYFRQTQFSGASVGLGGALKVAASRELLGGNSYEWVWILSPGVYLNSERLIHGRLGAFREASIVLFRDCEDRKLSGSIMIRKRAAERVRQYADDVAMRGVSMNDSSIFEGLVKLFGYFDQVKVHDTNELYWYQFPSCKLFFNNSLLTSQ